MRKVGTRKVGTRKVGTRKVGKVGKGEKEPKRKENQGLTDKRAWQTSEKITVI